VIVWQQHAPQVDDIEEEGNSDKKRKRVIFANVVKFGVYVIVCMWVLLWCSMLVRI